MTWLLPLLIGTLTGVISGMGIGGGTLLVLYLTIFTDTAATAAATINLVYFCGCAPTSLILHAKKKRVSGKTALLAAVGGSLTALVAALLVPDDSPDWLRRGFGVLLLTVGVRELITVWKAYHTEKKSGCS